MTLNLAGCWGPRQNVDSRWRGLGVAMGWFSYCWFWVIWLILNRLLNQSLLPLRIGRFARLATQVCVSFHRVIDCHLMPIDWPPDWLIAISRSINRHSLLVKSGHCAAFADWSTLEEKVDFEPIFSQLVAVTCSQWIQALLKIKKMRKFTFDRVSARCKLWLLWKKSPTTIPAPVIPFEDDPEYHDDDGDDTFGLLEHKTSADEVAAAAFIIVLTKKKTVGAPCLGIFWELTGSTKPSQFTQPSRW